MKQENIIGTVEKICLGEIQFVEDSMEFYIDIDIKEISKNLYGKILDAVEKQKENDGFFKEMYHRGWGETVVESLSLHVIVNKDKSIETSINALFEEVENEDNFDCAELEIDLTENEMELKAFILKGIANMFF